MSRKILAHSHGRTDEHLGNRIIIGNAQLQDALQPFLSTFVSAEDKIAAVQNALEGPQGKFWRAELGKWTVRMVPAELLVPEVHRDWRPIVREAVLFVVSKLSARRLAPKVVEQMGLTNTSPELRLLRFISKVPGLQKIGQVLARNRNLDPRLRRALIKLENGISDVSVEQIRRIIEEQLQSEMAAYAVKLDNAILSEASVSAVVGFTWKNPDSGRRERGVFKVLKPHIPDSYAEDMKILGQLARHLARKHRGPRLNLIRVGETLRDVKLLLQREVDFPREQSTIAHELHEYRSQRGVRLPSLIPALSTASITALSFEKGRKVTDVYTLPVRTRVNVAETLASTLMALPALSRETNAIFHADPHAGNLLYDRKQNQVVILDWALTERLTREQRKNILLLSLMMMLRDADGMCSAIQNLCRLDATEYRRELKTIRWRVEFLLDRLPVTQLPGAVHAMRLLDDIALQGIRFPSALLMFRKASFTLEGVVNDITGARVRLDSLMTHHALTNWTQPARALISLLSFADWTMLDWSLLTLPSRLSARILFRPWRRLWEFLPSADAW